MTRQIPDTAKWLDAFDSFASSLNRSCAQTPAKGNHFLIILEFNDILPENAAQRFFRKLPPLPPILFGKVRHFPGFAPYRRPGSPKQVCVSVAADNESWEDFANTPLPADVPFDCRIFPRSAAFRFSHLFFDGLGAERFLLRLFTNGIHTDEPTGLLPSSHMREWNKQRIAGNTFRKILLDPNLPHEACLLAKENVKNLFFTASAEAEKILNQAEQTAGPFMLIPFLQHRVASALVPTLNRMNVKGDLVIPMTVDRRGQEDHPSDALFFNHWSMLPVRISRNDAEVPPLSAFKKAFYQAHVQKLAELFRMASFPGRFAPYPLMRFLEKKYGRFLGGTFLFSLLEESGLTGKTVFDLPVKNVRHLPLIPPRPGLGIFFNQAGGNLNVTLSVRDKLFPDGEAEKILYNILCGVVEK